MAMMVRTVCFFVAAYPVVVGHNGDDGDDEIEWAQSYCALIV